MGQCHEGHRPVLPKAAYFPGQGLQVTSLLLRLWSSSSPLGAPSLSARDLPVFSEN
jgi:hypothetical protein